jgi:hypothetical protein
MPRPVPQPTPDQNIANVSERLQTSAPRAGSASLSRRQLAELRRHSFQTRHDNCYAHAEAAALTAARLRQPNASLLGYKKAIGVSAVYGQANFERCYGNDPTAADVVAQDDIRVDPDSARNAVAHAKKAIDAGYPVLVGVNIAGEGAMTDNYGEIAEHFLVMHSYETNDAGEVVHFRATDNAVCGTVDMTFHVDPSSGKIYRDADPSMPSELTQRAYQVDSVRVWRGLPPDSNAGVGGLTAKERRDCAP